MGVWQIESIDKEHMHRRRLLLIATALVLAILTYLGSTALVQPPIALAHSFVIGSDPVDGSTIGAVPKEVRIFFNATISPASVAHVYSVQNGNLVDVSAGRSSIAPSNPRELDTALKTPGELPQGSYEVKWTAVSNDDGHTTYGIIGFDVGFSSTGLSGTPLLGPTTSNDLTGVRTLTPTGLLSVAWDWLVFAALTLWIGILVMERLILTHTDRTSSLLDRAGKQALALQKLCLTVLLCGEIVILILRATRLSQTLNGGFDPVAIPVLIIESNYGHLWLARMALLIIALALLSWTRRPQSAAPKAGSAARASNTASVTSSVTTSVTGSVTANTSRERSDPKETAASPVATLRHTPLWLLLAGLIVLTYALSGDAAQVFQPHASAIVLDWLYRIAAGVWFGGLTCLGYILLPTLFSADIDRQAETLVALLRRFTPFLLTSMGILLVCGLFLDEASVHTPQQLLTDPYARALVIQSVITIVLAFLSLYTLLVQCPRLMRQALLLPVVNAELPARRTRQSALFQGGRSLKQAVNIQAWLGAAVLLCMALMVFFAPPIVFPNITYTNPGASTSSAVNAQTKQLGDLSVTLVLLPGRVDQSNTVVITIQDRNGAPVTDAQVQLSTNMQIMDMGTAHKTISGGNAIYTATFDKREAFSMAGLWIVNVEITRPGQAPVQTAFQVTLANQ